jgi:hypothetical protein
VSGCGYHDGLKWSSNPKFGFGTNSFQLQQGELLEVFENYKGFGLNLKY